ncbi:MAG: DEAD/DEAH box helicase family protein [Rhodobiaceae bacterium]|nr:DEAD/DEAH box helicase family protein [Rhodobiaceae bacterium]
MKFTLKSYQEEAVRDVLEGLADAKAFWDSRQKRTSFSLTATTGAGKTVMAAAVFEALFYGDDDYDFFQQDPGAVVIWFSDSPDLNIQSRNRLIQASDRLNMSDLVEVQNTFNRETLEAGKIYFLNTAKLSKNSLLVRGHDPSENGVELDANRLPIMPDARAYTMWDTIRNTIENPDLTLYLVLDEAHRGMGANANTTRDKPTIVKRLINGFDSIPGIPIVLGISATVQRFNNAMDIAANRANLPNVIVDSQKVQSSGLLKDTIVLDVPDEDGDFSTVLVSKATRSLQGFNTAWANYAAEQGSERPVVPLMVFQVPNKPDPQEIARALDAIYEAWPELPPDSIANVFGENRNEKFGRYEVPYIQPERVQDSEWVRVLLAKEAISTGWDCPRAEVMVSFRAARDETHITQMLGRMVRTPLARRIEGNEKLNSVDCFLPKFDKSTVTNVVKVLMEGGEAGEQPKDRRILINPVELHPDPNLPEAVWECLEKIQTQTIPRRETKPIKRLTILAHELAADGFLPDAGAIAHDAVHQELDALVSKHATTIAEARQGVLVMEGKTLTTNLETKEMSFDDFVEAADYVVIEEAYRRAGRKLSPALATSYAEHIAARDDNEDEEEALIDAHCHIAAVGLVDEVAEEIEAFAEAKCNDWLIHYKPQIRQLSDERRDIYRQIRELSPDPLEADLARPTSRMQDTGEQLENGKERDFPRYPKHLLVDQDGLYPEGFKSSWEVEVLDREIQKPETIAWYRNPSFGALDSLGVGYVEANENKLMRPDFIFLSDDGAGGVKAHIVDPHGIHLSDALPKLRGLVKYVEEFGASFGRVESIAKLADSKFRKLDLQRKETRDAISASNDVKELFNSAVAEPY